MSIKRLGPYQIHEILGRGGMGSVFRATHEKSQEEVAVKVLSFAYADDQRFRARFESEVATLMNLSHPNIVRHIDHGEDDGNLYFVMELVKGKSLSAMQKSGHRFTWQEVIGISMDVCAGLQHAHYRGIIHRDIKPANLLMTDAGTVKITDFGIAKDFHQDESLTAPGGAIGTADFMSPEQASGRAATEKSDLFSLGAVMYSLLSGRPPFAEKSVQSTIQKLTSERQVPLRDLSPETPSEIEEMVDRLLEKEPEKRIGTAYALNQRLVELLELMKADATAKTAVALELEDEDDDIYELAPSEMTIASSPMTSSERHSTLIADGSPPSKEPGTSGSNRTVVENRSKTSFSANVERKRKQSLDEYEQRNDGPVWPYALAMLVVLSLIVWGIASTVYSKPTADELFDKIVNSELPQEIDCENFLKAFPDDERVQDVRLVLDEIESRKLYKQLAIVKKLRGVRSMKPIQIMLLNAIEIRKQDPVKAKKQFDAIIHMYDGDEQLDKEERSALAAAISERERTTKHAEEFIAAYRKDALRSLARADAIKDDQPSAAMVIYQGLIVNLASREWATDIIEKAQTQLDSITRSNTDQNR